MANQSTTPTAPAKGGPRSKGPLAAHGGTAVAIVLVIAAVALPATQSPPPAIAEFAPQAQEQITEAPESQTSDAGEGEGGASNGSGEDGTMGDRVGPDGLTTLPTLPPREVPRTRRCVGDPPRQTEDPQSPPCVPFFEGDNGGATSKGVTADEIRIVAPANVPYAEAMAAHFNQRFELYGRQIRIVDFPGGGDMVSQAIAVDEEADAFASLLYGDAGGNEYVYYDELARRGVVSVNGRPSMAAEPDLARHHPHQWSYLPPHDVMSRNQAQWACNSLKGGNAEFGGGDMPLNERVFALVTTIGQDGSSPDLGPMKAVLDSCPIDIVVEETIVFNQGDQAGLNEARDIVIKLQVAGVTTVFCECHTQSSGLYLATSATSQGYFPEWLISTYLYQAEDIHAQFWEAQQVDHSFGLGWWSKQLRPEDSPWFQAIRDGDPNAEFANYLTYYDARWLYNSFLMLVAGLQMAGPNLTPESFGSGLQSTTFPNPNAGQAPFWQAEVGFQGDHSAVNDAAVVWLSKSERSVWDDIPGAVCYANRGQRYSLGRWPNDYAGLFQRPCY